MLKTLLVLLLTSLFFLGAPPSVSAQSLVHSKSLMTGPKTANTEHNFPFFLMAFQIGPAFATTGVIGAGIELEGMFRLYKRGGYLSLLFNFEGGFWDARDRGDFLLAGVVGYRHFFKTGRKQAFSLMGGVSIGTYFTTPGLMPWGFDWLHVGFKLMASYHWFRSDRLSIGTGIALLAANQISDSDWDDFFFLYADVRFVVTF